MRKRRTEAKGVFSGELVEEFREMLLRERDSLVRQIKSLSSASLTSSRQAGEELADVGSDDFIRETELHLMTEEGRRLALINLAIDNLEAGTYGLCVDCSKPIAVGRPFGGARHRSRTPWAPVNTRKESMPAAFSSACSASAASLTAASFFGLITQIATAHGAIAAGQRMPLSSWFCSIAAATIRDTPMP